jgi:hypothetical protein
VINAFRLVTGNFVAAVILREKPAPRLALMNHVQFTIRESLALAVDAVTGKIGTASVMNVAS